MLQIKSYGKFELINKISRKKIYWRKEAVSKTLSVPYKKVWDEIKITKSQSGGFEFFTNCQEIFNSENKVIQAAEYFFTEYPTLNQGIKLILNKQIPLASGLSAATSNAVATFKLLHEFFRMECSELALTQFAQIISPAHGIFFVFNEMGYLVKNGAHIKFHPKLVDQINPFRFTLEFNPDVVPDTATVYRHFLANFKYYRRSRVKHNMFYNDLELVVFDLYPALYKIAQKLKRKYKNVMLSGAGNTFICF